MGRVPSRQLSLVLWLTCASACAPRAFVAIEGPCSKLAVATLVGRTIVVHGRKDIDVHPDVLAQTLSDLHADEATPAVDLLNGLPTDARGYVSADLSLSGDWPRTAVLQLWKRTPTAPGSAGPWLAETTLQRLEGGVWTADGDQLGVGAAGRAACASAGAKLCWLEHARQELTGSNAVVVGQCIPCTSKALLGPARMVALHRASGAWSNPQLPRAQHLQWIDRVSLAARTASDAYLTIAGRSDPEGSVTYVAHFDGRAWSALETSGFGPVSSADGTSGGGLWITAGGRLWHRDATTAWSEVPLAAPALPGAPGPAFHADRVQVRAPGDIWVEASIGPNYRALLRSGRPGRLIRCNPDANAARGLVSHP